MADTERQAKDARNAVFEEFFQDYYKHRRQVYWMNFVRGIWFSLGAFIGGTLIIAALFWFLSAIHSVPFLSGVVESIQHAIQEGQDRAR